MGSRRLYLGKLPPDARSDDVQDLFKGLGKIVDCKVMTGFGFIEFDSSRDAEDAVTNYNGKTFMGGPIVVEFAKESRPRVREPYPEDRYPPGIRIIVSGISRDTSWQDLKDFGREAGSVSFADIDRDVPGQGVLEYLTRDDAERAVKDLDGKDLRGQAVRVALGDERDADNYRREDRGGYGGGRGGYDRGGYDRGGHDRGGYDRYSSRDDRGYDRDRHSYRDAPPRRDRSRSPRRGEDDRRARSPPPRRDYDAPRAARDYDAPRDDRRSARPVDDDRRRGDDDRRSRRGDDDDRAPPPRSGDGGWSR
ncbi:hypothetical protein PENSPDRAFT_132016 [Peniophora sp. CONT]|nr:hypothetical protein PENSPDRAFT_132016 [Peniophora sp. CONT]